MTTFLILAAWWFLARASAAEPKIAKAYGPFPSRELCRIAGHNMIPDAVEFFTAEMKQRRELERLEAEELRTQFERTLIENAMKKPGYKPGDMIETGPGTYITADATGKTNGWGSITNGWPPPYVSQTYYVVAPCTRIDSK